ncbi:hypothetical protein B0H19DRAFT_1141774 [Mycena capillaripes]|nr:hypothetical protein B0H19DRAFT_1141774 [Mycena capillaripes]
MPGRRVRFSPTNSFHSPPFGPPSLMGPSPPSSASSLGPLTPPALPYRGSAGPESHLPRNPHTEWSAPNGQAHNLIALSSTPLLRYDISLHPSLISSPFPGISAAGYFEPAVYPPQHAIKLVTPHLPWTISVAASNAKYVTVSDVLNEIYRTLRVTAMPGEFEDLRTDKLKRRVRASYTHRCEHLRGYRGYTQEKVEGVKRVDFLTGYTMFQGIAPTELPDVWQLTIS